MGNTRFITCVLFNGSLEILLALPLRAIWPKIKTFKFIPAGEKDMAVHKNLEAYDNLPSGQQVLFLFGKC